MDPQQILNELQAQKKTVDGILSKLKYASKNSDVTLYNQKKTELVQAINQLANTLEKAEKVPESTIEDNPQLNFSAKVKQYIDFGSSIEANMPPPPQQSFGDQGTAENQPLIGYDDGSRLTDQSNLVMEMHKDDTQQISDITTRMKDLNTGFTKLHFLAEIQQTQLDNIYDNVMTADTKVAEGVEEVGKAQTYQKKASRKLLFILLIVGAVFIVLAVIVAIILAVHFSKKDNGNN
ncbi:hypothetical protein EIN_082560 [Entamoeba invadens IP1]|uniref:hypothetical protein n=1 Tax=Entamoeba invadens IP1 TaxID=370355 RepID=UPI0002C3F5C3|nr:hypothetical protein EIN_082560 [Entamoeba invadens IP1]ELP85174.1 hypothetical protein EIN_082560 [Entamoeba invadens IP1]|eukprot:XP_004184520.1 hypothetical protein EIN_082560 [Entamoeba invadens IP1]